MSGATTRWGVAIAVGFPTIYFAGLTLKKGRIMVTFQNDNLPFEGLHGEVVNLFNLPLHYRVLKLQVAALIDLISWTQPAECHPLAEKSGAAVVHRFSF